MAQFTIYRSTDASAPVLTGQAGKLIDLLDACLVNGYGSKAAAGWAKAYTGTNKGVYRSPNGARHYYRILDDASTTGTSTGQCAIPYMYETMSDVDTGSPAAANVYARKSSTSDATARAWIVYADDRTAYVFSAAGGANYCGFAMGEFYSYVPSDAYRSLLFGAWNYQTYDYRALETIGMVNYLSSEILYAHVCIRCYLGTGTYVNAGVMGDVGKYEYNTGSNYKNYSSQGRIPFPNPSDGKIYLAPLTIHDKDTAPAPSIRGRMRGMWHFCHPSGSAIATGDTFSGSGALNGRTFELIRCYANYSTYTSGYNDAVLAIETSNTVDTN